MRNKSCFFILNGKRIEKDEILYLLLDLVNNFLEKILIIVWRYPLQGYHNRAPGPPQFLADQLLSPISNRVQFRPIILLRATPDFQTLRRPCSDLVQGGGGDPQLTPVAATCLALNLAPL